MKKLMILAAAFVIFGITGCKCVESKKTEAPVAVTEKGDMDKAVSLEDMKDDLDEMENNEGSVTESEASGDRSTTADEDKVKDASGDGELDNNDFESDDDL